MTREIRCLGPHPQYDGWQCRKKLAVVTGVDIHVARIDSRPPVLGDFEIACPRCGARWLIWDAAKDAA